MKTTNQTNFLWDLITIIIFLGKKFLLILRHGFIFIIKKSNHKMIAIYLFSVILFLFCPIPKKNYFLCIVILIISFMGIKPYIRKMQIEKKRKYFNAIFEKMNFRASDDSIPCYLYDTDK